MKYITVPVESTREVRVTDHVRDSIYLRDSIREVVKGDTIWSTSYRYLYRDKIVKDTVTRVDSIAHVVKVEVPGPVTNVLTSWQAFQVWCGRGLLAVLALYLWVKFLRARIGL